jgi:DNA polymerase-3 subunit beta
MKIKLKKSEFIDLVSKAQNIVERRTTMPILVNLLMDAQGSSVKIFATNLEVSLTDEANATVLTPGRAAANAKSLFDIIKEFADGDITLERQENHWLKIKQGKTVINLVGVNPDEYPVFPSQMSKDYTEIESGVLTDMISKTVYSVSTDETRYHLNGVYFEKRTAKDSDSSYLMVATDGHRLSLVNVSPELSTEAKPEGVIIPRKGLVEIHKLLEGYVGKVKMAIEGSQLVLCHQRAVLMIRLIEGKYPNYKQLVPQNLTEKVEINREELLSSLRRVSLLSNQKSKGVTLNFSSGKLEITSNNPELGDAKEELEVGYKGNELKIGFNARYIIDVLTSMDDDKVQFNLKDQVSPGVVRPFKDNNYTCVIMPMRI